MLVHSATFTLFFIPVAMKTLIQCVVYKTNIIFSLII